MVGTARRARLCPPYGVTTPSLELHVQALRHVARAQSRADDDAAADLSRGIVAGPHRVAALPEERIGVRRLGFGGIERIARIVVEDAGLLDAAAFALVADHFLV